jgi:hypothetical protein
MLGIRLRVSHNKHPGMPPRRNVELKIELKEGAEPVSKPVYRLSRA